jgi:transcriptional regulator with XRE-family HTH domain
MSTLNIRSLREQRRWSQANLAREIEGLAYRISGDVISVTPRTISRWEGGQQPSAKYARLLETLFAVSVSVSVFPETLAGGGTTAHPGSELPEQAMSADSDELALQLVTDLATTNLPNHAIEGYAHEVDLLCRAYLFKSTAEMLARAVTCFVRGQELHSHRLGFRQQNELVTAMGWVALLIGNLCNDRDDQPRARHWCRIGERIAVETGHREMQAWSYEMRSWFAVSHGEPQHAVSQTEAGTALVKSTPILPQLILKEANALAQLGATASAERAIDRAQNAASILPLTDFPAHHFLVDRLRLDFFSLEARAWLRQDELVIESARSVLARLNDRTAPVAPPSFVTESNLNLALAHVRLGEFTQAIHHVDAALTNGGRQTMPSLVLGLRRIENEMTACGAGRELAAQFQRLRERVAAASTAPRSNVDRASQSDSDVEGNEGADTIVPTSRHG